MCYAEIYGVDLCHIVLHMLFLLGFMFLFFFLLKLFMFLFVIYFPFNVCIGCFTFCFYLFRMITAFSWVPKGVAKAIPDRAELPSKEEIEKLKETCDQVYSEDEEDNTEDEKENGEVAHAKTVAEAFGKSSSIKNASSSIEVDDLNDDFMKELDMDNYDEEDDSKLAYNGFN